MASIKVRSMSELNAIFEKIPGNNDKAMAIALTKVAVLGKKREQEAIKSNFDRPTPWAVNSIFMKAANKEDGSKMFSRVGVKTDAEKYLRPNIEGGGRTFKGSERKLYKGGEGAAVLHDSYKYLVPARSAPLNNYGNVPTGQMSKIVSDTVGATTAGYEAKTKKAKVKYFPLKSKSGTPIIATKVSGVITPVLVGVSDVKYKKKLKFEEIMKETYDRNMQREYEEAFAKYIL